MGIHIFRQCSLLLGYCCLVSIGNVHASSIVPDIFKTGSWEYELASGALFYLKEDPDGRHSTALNVSLKADYYTDWNDGDDSFIFSPFLNINQRDSNMTYVDISELTWVHVKEEWETRIGIRQETWGTVIGSSLVDVINTSSGIFSALFDSPKLGQPMINFSRENNKYGTLDLYVLAGFRETNYPGSGSRPAIPLTIDDSNSTINNTSEYFPGLDYAARWVFPVNRWEVGLSYFKGVGRGNDWQPSLTPSINGSLDSLVTITPTYNSLEQVGVELSWTKNGLSLNFEGVSRHRDRFNTNAQERYGAAVIGAEYDIGQVFNTRLSAQGVLQYLHDDRKGNGNIGVFRENDILSGINLNFNDERESSLFISNIIDVKTYEQLYLASLSTNISDQLKVSLSAIYVYIPDEPIESNLDDAIDLSLEQINAFIANIDNTGLSPENAEILTNALALTGAASDLLDLIDTPDDLDQLQRYFNILSDENKLRILENESFIRFTINYYF